MQHLHKVCRCEHSRSESHHARCKGSGKEWGSICPVKGERGEGDPLSDSVL